MKLWILLLYVIRILINFCQHIHSFVALEDVAMFEFIFISKIIVIYFAFLLQT